MTARLHRERPTPPTWTTTLKATNTARMLAAAETLGLPEPVLITLGPHDSLGICVVVNDEWAYAAWLDMLDAPECRDLVKDGIHRRIAKGLWGDVRVEIQASTDVREAA